MYTGHAILKCQTVHLGYEFNLYDFFVSGKTFLNSIEYLDEKTDEWTTFSPSNNEEAADDLKVQVNGHSAATNGQTEEPLSRFLFDSSSHSTESIPSS